MLPDDGWSATILTVKTVVADNEARWNRDLPSQGPSLARATATEPASHRRKIQMNQRELPQEEIEDDRHLISLWLPRCIGLHPNDMSFFVSSCIHLCLLFLTFAFEPHRITAKKLLPLGGVSESVPCVVLV